MSAPRLQIRALEKAFGANLVLRGLDFALAPAEVHALVGGNGAGKSTLSKIIAGIERQDAGRLELDEQPYVPADRRAAQAAGVVMVLQELSVLPTLTVAENLFLGSLPARFGGVIDRAALHFRARAALTRVGLGELAPDTPASTLGVGHQQLVEIAAGLDQTCRVLILDEPTAALSGAETATLFALLRELRAKGVSILYISHRLNEIAALADRVSVLRDGRLIATRAARDATHREMVVLMAGEPLAACTVRSTVAGEPALRLRDIRAGSAVRCVSLEVRAGEIVGLGGLVGAGRTEFGAVGERAASLAAVGRREEGLQPVSVPGGIFVALLGGQRADLGEQRPGDGVGGAGDRAVHPFDELGVTLPVDSADARGRAAADLGEHAGVCLRTGARRQPGGAAT